MSSVMPEFTNAAEGMVVSAPFSAKFTVVRFLHPANVLEPLCMLALDVVWVPMLVMLAGKVTDVRPEY